MNSETLFQNFLDQQDEDDWARATNGLLPFIHEVDRTATQIWFAFYPITLFRALAEAEDAAALARRLLLQGDYYLRDQIDSSHKFLYGHRYWPEVKKAVAEHAASFNAAWAMTTRPLADQIREVAGKVAKRINVEESLLVGIASVAFMTVAQTGLAAFKAAPGTTQIDAKHAKRSPEQILKERAKDDSQGLFGFLRTVDKRWTVTYDENDGSASYSLIDMEELASGAARDKSRDWRALDPRCVEGPIPVECRSASCGTCWVGVLGGAEKLSDVSVREGKQMKEFGYINTDEPKPIIRLACMAQGGGAVSVVIPPWNGVFGKYLRRKAEGPAAATAEEEAARESAD
ncbi:MAG TPA: 2Fe-2S iron-sulfur cluster-binding protein [Pyrinomonadaceae bacterium]|jgi:ferredoxin|nr:2Fe-2S iron-sulfur cluster-binding protein [Pyrinomonadaceae bacterium]